MLVLKTQQGRAVPPGGLTLLVGRLPVLFRAGTLNGAPVIAATIALEDEPVVRKAFAARQDLEFYEGADSDFVDALVAAKAGRPAPVPQLNPNTVIVMRLRNDAIRNGWSDVDLDGTGKDFDPGPGGGFSARAGLTLAQLSLCAPPPGWEVASATMYPWDVAGWTPPGIGFKSPNVPSKVPVPVLSTIDGAVVVLPADGSLIQGTPVETVDGDLMLDPDADPEAPFVEVAANADPVDVPAALRGLFDELTDEAGAPPSLSKFKHRAKTAGLVVENIGDVYLALRA